MSQRFSLVVACLSQILLLFFILTLLLPVLLLLPFCSFVLVLPFAFRNSCWYVPRFFQLGYYCYAIPLKLPICLQCCYPKLLQGPREQHSVSSLDWQRMLRTRWKKKSREQMVSPALKLRPQRKIYQVYLQGTCTYSQMLVFVCIQSFIQHLKDIRISQEVRYSF